MCLNPLTIRNPTKVVSTCGGQSLHLTVNCGKCAQCLQDKRNEWYVRSYYEIQRTFSKGGYVYFDTLTYSDENIPRLSHFIDCEKYGLRDFTCFSHRHFKLFLKRLRRLISYRYKISKDAFRYFLTSEYGEDDRFTHRPHYHILFFVYFDITPLEFSQLVADCWQYGRTDGFPFKPAPYVYNHTYGYCGENTSFEALTSVCMYVSKYITKNSSFADKVKKRMMFLRDKVNGDSNVDIDELIRNIDMFHRQSQGFGLSYLHNMTPTQLMFLSTDTVVMKDKYSVVKTYPMPMYYKRHLYYTVEKHPDGTRYWQLTPEGVEHTISAKLQRVDKRVLDIMDIVNNCADSTLVDEFFALLDQREISDYVVYELFYKGRHRLHNSIDLKYELQKPLQDEEINLFDWLKYYSSSLTPYFESSNTIPVVDEKVRLSTLSNIEKSAIEDDYLKHGHFLPVDGSRFIDVNDYFNEFSFNENSDVAFSNFDKIGVLINFMTANKRANTQSTFEYFEDLKLKFKHLFNLNL